MAICGYCRPLHNRSTHTPRSTSAHFTDFLPMKLVFCATVSPCEHFHSNWNSETSYISKAVECQGKDSEPAGVSPVVSLAAELRGVGLEFKILRGGSDVDLPGGRANPSIPRHRRIFQSARRYVQSYVFGSSPCEAHEIEDRESPSYELHTVPSLRGGIQ